MCPKTGHGGAGDRRTLRVTEWPFSEIFCTIMIMLKNVEKVGMKLNILFTVWFTSMNPKYFIRKTGVI